VKTNLGPAFRSAQVVAIQPDGKIVVVGYSVPSTQARIVVVRYLPTGLPTRIRRRRGRRRRSCRRLRRALSVALQPDGKIVVGGQ
jgi:hypothetical protein